jgi:NAD+ diphosphatase
VRRPNTFAGGGLDRAARRRLDDAWLAERRADPASRAVAAGADGVLVHETADRVVPAELPSEALRPPAEPVLLGVDARGAVFAVDLAALGRERIAALAPGARVLGLRAVAPRLGQEDGALLAQAAALLHWHREHPRCARCGAETAVAEGGHVRTCPSCGALHHPRTDPVVIMLVLDGDRALLGRQARWPPGRYSALAGFVEPGESLEEAVAREVAEEAGVAVEHVRYRSSQPWPFPASLMLGFVARHAGGEPSARDGELEDVRWFGRAEVDAMRAGHSERFLPPPDAIARRLIDDWLDAPPAPPAAAPIEGHYALVRLDPAAPLPDWVPRDAALVALARTAAELSIVCPQEAVPSGVTARRGYAALRVEGPLDHALVGVLAGLTAALADAGVPVFAVSTYDTDYLLVPHADLDRALAALAR